MKTAVIYARYSTDKQNPKSAEDQIAYCMDRIHLIGDVTVVKTFSDSAMTGSMSEYERPGLQELIDYISTDNIDILIFESLDRLSRDAEDTHRLHKIIKYHNAKMYSINEGWVNDLLIGLKSTMNEMTLQEISDRVMRSHLEIAKEGRLPGGKAYGYHVDRNAVDTNGRHINGIRYIIPKQAEIVVRIFEMYADGAGSKAIAKRLNIEGIPSPSGGFWSPSTILGSRKKKSGILFNEIYRGKLVYNRMQQITHPLTKKRKDVIKPEQNWVVSDVPKMRIISEGLWNKVQARLMGQKPRKKAKPSQPSSMSNKHLSGLVVCGVCGSKCQRANGTRYVCGSYRNHRVCQNARGLKSETIISEVYQHLEKHINESNFSSSFEKFYAKEKKKMELHSSEIIEIDKNIEHFTAIIRQGVHLAAITEGLKELQEKRIKTVSRMNVHIPKIDNNTIIVQNLQNALEEMRQDYDSSSFAPSWRAAMSLLVDKVITTPIPNKKQGMTIEVQIAGVEGWADFYRRITAKKASC